MEDGLKKNQRDLIIAAIAKRTNITRAELFGSRAMGTFTPSSDVDIALFGENVSLTDEAAISGELEETTIPYKVDLLRYNTITSPALKEHIKKHGRVIYESDGKGRAGASDRVPGEAGAWKTVTMAEIASKIAMGPFGSDIKTDNFVLSGVPIIRGCNLNYGRFNSENFVFLTEEKANQLSNASAFPDDIVFTHRGTLGQVGLVPHTSIKRYIISQSQMKMTCSRKLAVPGFVYYFFKSPVGQYALLMNTSQTGVPAISRPVTSLKNIKLSLPPLQEQRAIASILGSLDDKIELNRRMNQTLEEMARAIFKSWFVDFDPVRAKAEGRDTGLPPHIADLFPDSFEDSDLGEIPKGWEVTSLADQITASKGLSYKGQHLCEPGGGLPMHNLNSVYEGGGYKNEGLKWYNGEYRPAHILKPGDVIVTNTEQGFDHLLIGYAAIVPERYGTMGLFSHHIFRIQQKASSYLPTWFIYLLLRTQRFHDLVAGHSNGTTVNMLPLDGLQKPKFVLPTKDIVECFGCIFTQIQPRLEHIHDENITLAALRDTLLPKLISGELRVPDAGRIVERAL